MQFSTSEPTTPLVSMSPQTLLSLNANRYFIILSPGYRHKHSLMFALSNGCRNRAIDHRIRVLIKFR
jgi:hypothetical protein